ncbi:pyruvate kinase [Plasmodium ovale wallikeri]|uniref:Pyruvate kinase n=2 Tax=Plasmodium ovale TaxID=36330 RepID=A0A1A8YNB9_PLAOA|nr:pyruvate kinase [Plasmodium ovale wallikeri]SBT33512.1 pyruvate kinase [Plasmodium ovale wallikeri]SBT76195.1 pyruvate kinase 2, putative [Plasmodium ovale]
MNVVILCFFIELMTCFSSGLKYKKKVACSSWYAKNAGGGLLFLNNAYINKHIDRKKGIFVHTGLYSLTNPRGRAASMGTAAVGGATSGVVDDTGRNRAGDGAEALAKKSRISFTKSKQIATIGPATERFEELEKLYLSGIDVFRLNFSHGPKSIKKYIINSIRILEKKYDTSIAILGDIQGPKIRIGEFERNEKNTMETNTFVELKKGDLFSFDLLDKPGDEKRVQLNYPDLLRNAKAGQIILLDDGNLKMKIVKNKCNKDGKGSDAIEVEVVTGGKLYSKKGFCIPNMIMPIEVLNEKDVKDILFCINEGVDFLGYSFVQTKYDLMFLKNIIKDYYESNFFKNKKKDRINYDINSLQWKDHDDDTDFYIQEVNDYYQNYYLKKYETYKKIYDAYNNQDLHIGDDEFGVDNINPYDTDTSDADNSAGKCGNLDMVTTENASYSQNCAENSDDVNKIFIISKIEKPSAVRNIESIVQLSDGIMIARGDLGIETNLSNLPILQKKIINLCRIKYHKPVIVATQMLESMRFLPSPTRAEVTDVATALYDGADCVMLSAETATGQYPILTASTQNSIIKDVENDYYYYEYTQKKNYNNVKHEKQKNKTLLYNNSYFEKLIYSIRDLSNNINLKSIVLCSNEFHKIQKLSNLRTKAPIIVITENVHLARKLQLTWGIYSHLSKLKNLFNNDLISLINYGCKVSKEEGFVNSPDEYSLLTFTKNISTSANLLYLCQPCLTN